MSAPALYLESLEINRMPGFPPVRAFPIDDLSPGINVIHGPNESGKTTMAKAIALTVHGSPSGKRNAILRGRVRMEEGSYDVRVDAGERTFLKNGEPDPGPALPPVSTAHRYKLWLHELLQAEDPNRDFAQQILQESAGGYDVREARDALGFRPAPSPAAIRERQEYKTKNEHLKQVLRGDDVIDPRKTEERLRRLMQERTEAETAEWLGSALEQALTYRRHQSTVETIERRLEELPEALTDVTGNEPERLEKLREELANAQQAVQRARNESRAAQEQFGEADLPDEDPPKDLVPTLRRRVQTLKGIEGDIETLEREVRTARSKKEGARTALGDAADPEKLRQVNTGLLQRAERFAQSAESLRERQATLEAVDRWLSEGEPSIDVADLREAIRALRRWLQVPEGQASTIFSLKVAALAASALNILAGAGSVVLFTVGLTSGLVGFVGVLLLAAGLLLLFLSWRWGRGENRVESRETYESDYRHTPLEPPPAWEPDVIQEHLSRLERNLVEIRLAEERERLREKLRPDREALAKEEKKLEKEAERLAHDLGARLDLGERSFLWFIRTLAQWQEARTDLAGAEDALATARDQHESLIEEIRQEFTPYGGEAPSDADSALTQVELLDERLDTFRSAKDALGRARSDEKSTQQEVDAKEQQIRTLFEKLGLEPGDNAGLQQLCRLRGEYEDAVEEKAKVTPLRDQALKELREEPAFEERMEDLSETEIEAELEGLQSKRHRLVDLRDEIPRLEQKIQDAKREVKVEAALEARDRALAALRRKLEEETAQVVGWTVAEHIHQRTHDYDRPAVFYRARELFARVTRGRYQLQLSDSEPPGFRALDTRHSEVKSLNQLSSGTRVQLLLAVRLAFVEHQERGPKLPILLDETLANTDDIRARAIIEALIEIARGGRQVFYLTAQKDEVAKWKAALHDEERRLPSYRFIDLARSRSLTEELAAPTVEYAETSLGEIPRPDGMGHQAYGEALSVPAFNPAADVGDAHIWYLMEDPNLIHTLLQFGIERWGQVRTLREDMGKLATVLPEDRWTRIKARSKALSALRSAWSIGRGKPVDRAILEEAPGVTERKIEAIAALAERVGGNAGELLAALERGEVPRFYQSQYEKLEEFLHQEGFVDEREKLSLEDIKDRVLANVAGQIEAGVLTQNEVLALLENATKGV